MPVKASKPDLDPAPADADIDPGLEPGVDLGRLPDLVGYVLRRAQLAVFHDFHRSFAELDIRPTQFAVLDLVQRNPGLRPSQLSEALGIKRTNLVVLLDALEDRGLLKRERAPGDRRATALFITPAGARLLTRLWAVNDQHEATLTARLGEQGRRDLLALLRRLLDL